MILEYAAPVNKNVLFVCRTWLHLGYEALSGGGCLEVNVPMIELLWMCNVMPKWMRVGCARLNTISMHHIGVFTELKHLDLRGVMGLTNKGMSSIGSLTNLRHLDLGGCTSIGRRGLEYVSKLVNLRWLSLDMCQSVIHGALRTYSSLTKLTFLRLSHIVLYQRSSFECLEQMKSLNELDLRRSVLIRNEHIMSFIKRCSNITCIDIRGAQCYPGLADELKTIDTLTVYHGPYSSKVDGPGAEASGGV
jgi:hypothetical protein